MIDNEWERRLREWVEETKPNADDGAFAEAAKRLRRFPPVQHEEIIKRVLERLEREAEWP